MAIPGCSRRHRQEGKNAQCSGKSQKTRLGVCIICKGGEEKLMGQQEQVGSTVCSCKFGFWADFLLVVTQLKVTFAQDPSSSSFFYLQSPRCLETCTSSSCFEWAALCDTQP